MVYRTEQTGRITNAVTEKEDIGLSEGETATAVHLLHTTGVPYCVLDSSTANKVLFDVSAECCRDIVLKKGWVN